MTDADILELWHERAAIMQYDGGMTRAEAERAAYFDLRRCYGPKWVAPLEIREAMNVCRNLSGIFGGGGEL